VLHTSLLSCLPDVVRVHKLLLIKYLISQQYLSSSLEGSDRNWVQGWTCSLENSDGDFNATQEETDILAVTRATVR